MFVTFTPNSSLIILIIAIALGLFILSIPLSIKFMDISISLRWNLVRYYTKEKKGDSPVIFPSLNRCIGEIIVAPEVTAALINPPPEMWPEQGKKYCTMKVILKVHRQSNVMKTVDLTISPFKTSN